jgi:very-short-patch-repair endonuclease
VEPLPDGSPAIVRYRAQTAGPSPSPAALVAAVLVELHVAAVSLFPAWLPGAAGITGSGGAAVPAVRLLAARLAGTSRHFGPFLADLAEAAVRRDHRPSSRFAPEVRAAGLARVLADSFGRLAVVLLVEVAAGFDPDGERKLVTAAEWLAQHGGFGVWLTGAPLTSVDRVEAVPVDIPAELVELDREHRPPPGSTGPGPSVAGPGWSGPEGVPALSYPPVAGRPHPASRAEAALEAALAPCPWAAARAWNQTYQSHPLARPVRVDLLWADQRCVVEVDGPEHRDALRFAADRRRDVQLQLDGYGVLRFTNAQVLDDVGSVVAQIARFLRVRRPAHPSPEGRRDDR